MITIAELARALDAEAAGDTGLTVTGAAEPAAADPDQIALAMQPAFAADLAKGRARAAILWPGADWQALGLAAAIMAPRPRYVLAGIGRAFDRPPEIAPGIHPSAAIDPTRSDRPRCSDRPLRRHRRPRPHRRPAPASSATSPSPRTR